MKKKSRKTTKAHSFVHFLLGHMIWEILLWRACHLSIFRSQGVRLVCLWGRHMKQVIGWAEAVSPLKGLAKRSNWHIDLGWPVLLWNYKHHLCTLFLTIENLPQEPRFRDHYHLPVNNYRVIICMEKWKSDFAIVCKLFN